MNFKILRISNDNEKFEKVSKLWRKLSSTWLNVKVGLLEKEKEAYKNKGNVIFYFGVIFFDVQTRIFVLIFQSPGSNIVSLSLS